MHKKPYKALMLDLDGTTIPNDPKGMPSKKILQAINAASKKLHVGAVTGRPYIFTEHVIKELQLTGPSIFGGGSRIIDTSSGQVVWEALLVSQDIQVITNLFKKMRVDFVLEGESMEWKGSEVVAPEKQKLYGMAGKDLTYEEAEYILNAVKDMSTVNAHKIVGWKKGTYWVQVTHADASKQHGILEIAKILNIDTHEIIGVGDGYNDFPLLMACGLKIAMGNAVPELKAIADYVAPSVDDDGVAHVIEKFIL